MRKTHEELYTEVMQAAEKYGIVIEHKAEKWYWRVIGKLLHLITFGNVDFMNSFFTTFGNHIGTAVPWDTLSYAERYEVLLHELEHVKQYKKAGLGNVWVGFVLVGFAYLFLPLPIGLAWCRAKIEMEGYAQSIRALVRLYGVRVARSQKGRIVEQFTSINYLFMWPFRGYMDAWFDSTLRNIAEEEGELYPW